MNRFLPVERELWFVMPLRKRGIMILQVAAVEDEEETDHGD